MLGETEEGCDPDDLMELPKQFDCFTLNKVRKETHLCE